MKNEHENKKIGCSVDSCKFHSDTQDFCTLHNIEVGSCANGKPQSCDATCCQSFQTKAEF